MPPVPARHRRRGHARPPAATPPTPARTERPTPTTRPTRRGAAALAIAVLGGVWALPCSLLGLAVGLALQSVAAAWPPGRLAAPRLGRRQRVGPTLEWALWDDPAPRHGLARRLPFDAITFGQVVVGRSPQHLAALRAHERVHVRQYAQWGPLFLLAYPLASGWAWLRGQGAYRGNWFERQAWRADRGVNPPARPSS